MSREGKLAELENLLAQYEQIARYDIASEYKPGGVYEPTPKQMQFHEAGARFRDRGLLAGNQTGKSFCAAMEISFHLTGDYPDWWEGHRFTGPIQAWAAGVTSESTRDNPQRLLLGNKRDWGSGTVPKHMLFGEPMLSRGMADAVDSFQVRHISGGVSTCWFKSYERGREKWQGATLHLIWADEEPPMDIYNEAKTRLNYHKGHFMLTMTPLLGMTKVCDLYFEEQDKAGKPGRPSQRTIIHMTLNDAQFYSDDEKEDIVAQYPESERRARIMGLPALGEGLIYPHKDEDLWIDGFEIPPYFRRIAGIDFGVEHATAGVWVAFDPDKDVVYIYDEYKKAGGNVSEHAEAFKRRGDWIPVSWPHDGLKSQHGESAGMPIKDMYLRQKVNMLPMSARYHSDKGGGQPREPIIAELNQRMKEGKFKVFKGCREWMSEKNRYHRKDGKPVAYDDDLMSATHYALMMLRFSRPQYAEPTQEYAVADYDPLTY